MYGGVGCMKRRYKVIDAEDIIYDYGVEVLEEIIMKDCCQVFFDCNSEEGSNIVVEVYNLEDDEFIECCYETEITEF